MCDFIKSPNVAMGWGCCRCRVYNGIQRVNCKECGEPHHEPLTVSGDCAIGTYHEDGGITSVKVLAVTADADGVGLKLKAIGTEQCSQLVRNIPEGHVFDVWRKHNAGACYGLWNLE